MDLTEAEDIKRWQECREELYQKDLHNPDNHDGVITHLDILECKVKWALEESLQTKLVEVMEFQLSYFKSWKMMLWKCCTQYPSKFGKLSSGHRTGKGPFSIPKKGNAKECSNYCTIALISHTSKVMLKILQDRLQQYMNCAIPDVLEKAEKPEIKLPTSAGSWKKQESSRKTSASVLLTTPKPLTAWIMTNWKILKETGIPDHLTWLLRNLYAGQEATVRKHSSSSSEG